MRRPAVPLPARAPDEIARRDGTGALLGHLTGFGVGSAYGLLRPGPLSRMPRPLAAIAIGAAASVGPGQAARRVAERTPVAQWIS